VQLLNWTDEQYDDFILASMCTICGVKKTLWLQSSLCNYYKHCHSHSSHEIVAVWI